MKRWLVLASLLVSVASLAAPGSYSGNIEPSDGSGPLPLASIVLGCIAGGWLAYASLREGDGLGSALQAGFWGFCIGGMAGILLSIVAHFL